MTTVAIAPLYLSRLILNPRSRQVWSELAHPYEMHRTLMRAFPEVSISGSDNPRERYGVLFRADMDDSGDHVKLYVQSIVKPDWSFLAGLDDYLIEDPDPPKDLMEAYQKLQSGQVLVFRLRANPTKRIAKPGDGSADLKGKRVGLLKEEQQISWLIRKGLEREKGKPGGFEILMKEVKNRNGEVRLVPRVNVCCEGKQKGRKMEEERPHETTHLAVRFDGFLRITEVNAFVETLVHGIGPAKAFGFGLLSVAKA